MKIKFEVGLLIVGFVASLGWNATATRPALPQNPVPQLKAATPQIMPGQAIRRRIPTVSAGSFRLRGTVLRDIAQTDVGPATLDYDRENDVPSKHPNSKHLMTLLAFLGTL